MTMKQKQLEGNEIKKGNKKKCKNMGFFFGKSRHGYFILKFFSFGILKWNTLIICN
jgi:hypothetical protein